MMKLLKRMPVVVCLWLSLAPAQADILATDAIRSGSQTAVIVDDPAPRAQAIDRLVAGGVEPGLARQRVAAMTDRQVIELAGRMAEMPAGAGVSTTNLLLIIIILVLLL